MSTEIIFGIVVAAVVSAVTYLKCQAIERAKNISVVEAADLMNGVFEALKDGEITEAEAVQLLKSAWEAQKK